MDTAAGASLRFYAQSKGYSFIGYAIPKRVLVTINHRRGDLQFALNVILSGFFDKLRMLPERN